MILLFSYGTLTNKNIQLEEFNTTFNVENTIEEIKGFDMSNVEINGINYNIIIESNNESTIKGKIVHIPENMIKLVDEYEGNTYKRIPYKTISNRDCFIYVKK